MRRSVPARRAALAALLGAALLGAVASGTARAQEVPADTLEAVPTATADALEELAEAGIDAEDLAERLAELRANPLDVNAAGAEDLASLPGLSPVVAAAIVRSRLADGPFGSLPELQRVPGVTPEVYAAVRPYLTIGPRLDARPGRGPRFPRPPSVQSALAGLRVTATQRVQRRVERAAGFVGPDSTRAFAGSPERLYTRIHATSGRQLSLNLTLDKDPGERFRFDRATRTYGFDFVSGHAALTAAGRIDALVLGDFTAQVGQGVALWSGSAFGKGSDATGGPVRSGRGLRASGSSNEVDFLRGAALSLRVVPSVSVSGFVSRRRRTAALGAVADSLAADSLAAGVDAVVTSLSATGLHRTAAELARKAALPETVVGGGAEWRRATPRLVTRAGVFAAHTRFGVPVEAGTRPDQRFAFSGDRATVLTAYADARVRGGQVFGEVARGASVDGRPGGIGAVGGLGATLGGGAEVLLLGRHYGRDFVALQGAPFAERAGVGQNETGLYAGLRLRPSRTWTVNAFLDQYRFPWLRFAVGRPSAGREALVAVEHRPRRFLRLAAQGRTETREVGATVAGSPALPDITTRGLDARTRQSLRLQAEWDAARTLRFRARVEGSRVEVPGGTVETGSLVYQDVRLQARPWLRLDTRLTLFRTDGFESRLYAFENDIAGAFSIPALSGRGARAYVLASATPARGVTVQAKAAVTQLRGVRQISSGTGRIDGDRARDVGLLVRVRL